MNEGIYAQELTEHERFIRFEKGRSYVVPSRIKHQIIHDADMNDIGIAISMNGRADFRQYDSEKIYWFTHPFAWVVSKPIGGNSVDLAGLV
jgi:hypothetical protein